MAAPGTSTDRLGKQLCSGARENTPCRVPPVLGKGKEMRGAGRLQGGEKLNKKPNWASPSTNSFPTILVVTHRNLSKL